MKIPFTLYGFCYRDSLLLSIFVQSYRMVIFIAAHVIWESSTRAKRYTRWPPFNRWYSIRGPKRITGVAIICHDTYVFILCPNCKTDIRVFIYNKLV